ncbi:unnamed protein product, partial [Symbiodinium sp. CCMP2456]
YLAAAIRACKSVLDSVKELKELKPPLRKSIGKDRAARKDAQTLPAVQLEDGSIAADREQAEARWVRHFSAIEAGWPEDPETIAAECVNRQRNTDLSAFALELADVPNRTHIESGLRNSPCGRAAGKDRIPTDFLHHFAANVSLPLYQLVLKMSFRCAEPLQWKGGEVHQIWKRKGPSTQCDSFRAILVSSAVGKAVHGAFRTKCAPLLDRVAAPLQVGGRQGYPVQIAVHTARLFQEATRH